ncbi:hypothetical protein BRE01_29280 [Brevibacillus reuszeri]|uniref:Uncharacterized protein n=2 Tax=Brevibacillus reuszeri TaxID=54915 RepID=A0ABQ0TN05_9BACL|nr:hypothetical protein [Brevibacillus reuszeri]GED69226.1 hypothetical protein BRE01_29280 [Brevibacillus reuszeri]
MNNMNGSKKVESTYAMRASRSQAKNFVLGREVLMAYISPAIMAGIGGLITADRNLQIGALTTIGGTSALVALLLGLWLQSRGRQYRWIMQKPHLAVVGMFALAGVSIGLIAAWTTTSLVNQFYPNHQFALLSRVWTDFPLSATIASTLIAWRWRLATKPLQNGGMKQ